MCFVFFLDLSINAPLEEIKLGFWNNVGTLNNYQVGKLLLLAVIFLYFEIFVSKEIVLLKWFASLSFGLFFIHGFFWRVFNKFAIEFVSTGWNRFCFEMVFVFGFSILTVLSIRFLLSGRSRYVIGC